ncbi:MAG: hypothetical protein LLG06_01660 [Desulfobacteraceae bacterium]|nr:hypothetical protein [Desulfobacteraceae bacterium]
MMKMLAAVSSFKRPPMEESRSTLCRKDGMVVDMKIIRPMMMGENNLPAPALKKTKNIPDSSAMDNGVAIGIPFARVIW